MINISASHSVGGRDINALLENVKYIPTLHQGQKWYYPCFSLIVLCVWVWRGQGVGHLKAANINCVIL
jgi:hypothetical protein